MGHATRASAAQNYHFWPPGEPTIDTTGSTTLSIPDSYSFVKIKATAGQTIQRFDTEWFEGRVLSIWIEDGSSNITFKRDAADSNIFTTGLEIVIGPRRTVNFRAVRQSDGTKVWNQVVNSAFS